MSGSSPDKAARPENGQVNRLGLLALVMLGVIVLSLTLALAPPAEPVPLDTPTPPVTPYHTSGSRPLAVAEVGQRVEREAEALTTLVPTLTPYLTPTIAPVTPIPWTEEDVNALTWLCYEEVRGMGSVRYDACLSVISTVRRRYAYGDDPYGEDTIAETLLRENQFPISFQLDQPAPGEEVMLAVQNYQWGARGSCTGYLYYDSVPGGPSLCEIRAANGQFVEFHNGWR